MQQNKKFLRVLCSLLAAALAAWCTVLLCRWVGYDLQELLGNTPSYEIINDDYSQIIDIPAEGLTQAMPLASRFTVCGSSSARTGSCTNLA